MDTHAPTPSASGGATWWTDEKHLHFLDSLESSFLRTMFVGRSNRRPVLRLDRHLPDSSDSTSDLTPPRTRKTSTSRDICGSDGPAAKKSRHSRQSRNPSGDDQVVPQIAKRAADEDEKDTTDLQASQARPT